VFNLYGVIRTHTVSRKSACGTAMLCPRAAAGNPDVRRELDEQADAALTGC